MISSGSRQALSMASGWLVSGAIVGAGLFYATEVKDIAKALLGIKTPPPAQTEMVARRPARQSGEVKASGRTVEIKSGGGNHYFASIDVNGRKVDVMVDTGASMVALTHEDARRLSLSPGASDFTLQVQTANGMSRFAPVTLDRVAIGGIEVRNVQAAVAEPGRLSTTLLGMSFLSRLQRVDMRAGVMILAE
jgi:aspartyl protease family protein